MTTAAWPAWIDPPALQDGFGESLEDNVAAFTPDVGPPILRRRSSISSDLITVKGWFSSSEWEDIRAFYRSTLKDGTQQFTMEHPRSKTSATWLFVPGSPPKVGSTFGLIFEVQFSLRLVSGGATPPTLKFNRPSNSQYLGVI